MLKEINERQLNKMRKSIAWTEWIYQKEKETIFLKPRKILDLKNTISALKSLLEVFNSSLNQENEGISKFETGHLKSLIQRRKKKKMKKNGELEELMG